jgi:endonuclease III
MSTSMCASSRSLSAPAERLFTKTNVPYCPAVRKPEVLAMRLISWFTRSARDLPWRRTADPYAIWVSEVMLQQTQVRTVIPYWERWMTAFPTIAALAEADSDRVLKHWEGLGYYSRARNLQAAAREILRCHRGTIPATYEEVLNLPGVGEYTAGAICSIAFNQPTPVLDGNVVRVLTRLFAIGGDPKSQPTRGRLKGIAQRFAHAAASLPGPGKNCSHVNQGWSWAPRFAFLGTRNVVNARCAGIARRMRAGMPGRIRKRDCVRR